MDAGVIAWLPPVERQALLALAREALESSVRGWPMPVAPADELFARRAGAFEVGRHGLVISQGGLRGLLLPQVAVEWGWTRDEFLSHTCRKAGLPHDAWQRGAEVFAFEAEIFSEGEP